jgi:hypothetical protein
MHLLTDVDKSVRKPLLVIFLWKKFRLRVKKIWKIVVKVLRLIFHYEII